MKWILITVGIAIVVAVVGVAVFVNNANSEFSEENKVVTYIPSKVMRENVETYWQIMRAAVYESVTSDRADEFREDMDWFSGFVKERTERYGELQSIDAPLSSNASTASIVVRFEKNTYEFALSIDSIGEIANIKLTNFAPEETLTILTWADLGDDTLRVTTIEKLSSLKEAFKKEDGSVRLVSILSPT